MQHSVFPVSMGAVDDFAVHTCRFYHYCAAKAGILGFTRALARELTSRKIRVNAIAPGWIDTEFIAPLAEERQMIAFQTPMKRLGDVDDIAWAAVYLASEESKFLTGQVLSPNGGWTMNQ